ncbi:mycothiol synthase [Dietzia sp. PP-33]|jgi:mycothiol synthase|uniref:mycothiol synthase n=1 Tax=Dietzia sp. PP-33 TaxID=2957500 RepID=UPI0029B20179|nr:mycothiol synthase [Dietzia sp. PP-33]MDX2356859.1 mycothiol synthase [Dietzia sp. PP-33]
MTVVELAVDEATAARIDMIARDAEEADGVAPLGEQPLRALREGAGEGVRHLLVRTGEDDEGGIAGYAQLVGAGAEATAELVVAPDHRRRGVGAELLRAVFEREPAAAVWAHGDLSSARALAGAEGLVRTRELLKMRRRSSAGPELPEARPPEGIETGTLAEAASEGGARWPGMDARSEFLRVNNAAFSWHPEQGGWTRDQLDERLAVDWVDTGAVFLAVDTGDPGAGAPRLAGFHWTKTVAEPGTPVEGEVYVVAVDPVDQGRGLGGLLTALGVAHLEGPAAAESVVLYVEGDNTAAIRTYEKLGFAIEHRDVTYASG